MEERESAHDELGGMNRPAQPWRAKYTPPKSSNDAVENLLRRWYDGGSGVHPRVVAAEIIEELRRLGWREPPSESQGQYADWRRRADFRLPQDKVQAHLAKVREQLHASRAYSDDAAGPVGTDGDAVSPDASAEEEAEG